MLVACWSSKGGAGTTVVAATLALLLGRRRPDGALLADLAGDAPPALGLADPETPGLAGWLAAGPDVPPDALHRLEVRGGRRPRAPPTRRRPAAARSGRRARPPPRGRRPRGRRRLRHRSQRRGAGRRRQRHPLRARHPACFLALRRATTLPAAPVGGRAAHRTRPRPRPRRRRAHGGRAGRRRGGRRPAGRPRRRRRAARPAACLAASPGSSPVPPDAGGPAAPGGLVDDIHAALLAGHPEQGADLAAGARTRCGAPTRCSRTPTPWPWPRAVTARVAGLGPLEPLLADDAVTEVMVNGAGVRVGRAPGALDRAPIDLGSPARGRPPRRAHRRSRSGCEPTARRRSPTPACPTGRG